MMAVPMKTPNFLFLAWMALGLCPLAEADEALKTYAQWEGLCNKLELPPQKGAPCLEPVKEGHGGGRRGHGGRVHYLTVAPSSKEMLVTLSGIVLAKGSQKLIQRVDDDSEARTLVTLKGGLSCTLMSAHPGEGVSPLEDAGVLQSFRRIYKDGQVSEGVMTTRKLSIKGKPALAFDDQHLIGLYIRDDAAAIWTACDGELDKRQRQAAQQWFDSIVMSSRAYL